VSAVLATAEVPHPIYLLVPFFATFGGFLSALAVFLSELRPDWGRSWVVGNILGAGCGLFVVVLLYACGVDSAP
jgi:hypothetical protein